MIAVLPSPSALPLRSSSLPSRRPTPPLTARIQEKPMPALPVKRVYTLKEYLASCREGEKGVRWGFAESFDEEEEEEEEESESDGASLFSSISSSDSDLSAPSSPASSCPSSTSRALPFSPSAPPVPPKPQDPLEAYVTHVCSLWEDQHDGWMYSLFPKHPEARSLSWVVRYGAVAYVRAWYPVRVPGSSEEFDHPFWSWPNTCTMSLRDLEQMGLEFLPPPRPERSSISFPRWDLTTPKDDDDWCNMLHYGCPETPTIRLLPCPDAEEEEEQEGQGVRTVAEMFTMREKDEKREKLWPGSVCEVKDGTLRAGFGKRVSGEWERLQRKEKELGRMLEDILRV